MSNKKQKGNCMNRIKVIMIAAAMGLFLTACGPSKENLEKLNASRDSLTTAKVETEKLYGLLTTEDSKDKLDELNNSYNEYGDMNLEKVKNKEALNVVAAMDELKAEYDALYSELNEELSRQQGEQAEADKWVEILCLLKNSSGSELSSIVLRDADKAVDSENLLTEEQTLPSGRMMDGVVLSVYKDSVNRSLVVTDTLGNVTEYALELADIETAINEGISVTIKAPDQGVAVGSYNNPEAFTESESEHSPEAAETEESASEGN